VDIERRLCLPVADGHSEGDQRLVLVEMQWRGFGGRIIEFHHLDSSRQQVIGDELVPSVGETFEVGGENWMGFEQRIIGSRQGIDIDRARHVRGETHKIMGLSEHLLAVRQLPNDRRGKHFPALSYAWVDDRSTRVSSSLADSSSSS